MASNRRGIWIVVGLVVAVCAAAAGVRLAMVAGGAAGGRSSGTSGGNGTGAGQGEPLRVVVSIPPLKGVVEGLLPAAAEVEVLIPPGVSEHGYEIPPSRMAALARADVVVYVGLGLEPAVEKFLRDHPRPDRQAVCFAEAVGVGEADPNAPRHTHGDEHEPDHEQEHGAGEAVDPHLWLDPVLVGQLVPSLRAAVETAMARRAAGGSLSREAKGALEEAETGLKRRIAEVDNEYRDRLGTKPQFYKVIVVAHDAYGWLARRYGLRVVALAGLNASEPTPGAIERAIKTIKDERVVVIFVEPQLSQDAVRRLAQETFTQVRMLDPLGDGDWFGLMRRNLEAIHAAVTMWRIKDGSG